MKIILFNKCNEQYEHKCIARDVDDCWVIGWLVIEKPINSSNEQWTYWMYLNTYNGTGIKDGVVDFGLNRVQIKPETIKPYNNVEKIKHELRKGELVELIANVQDVKTNEKKRKTLSFIRNENEIPYELWGSK